MNNIVIHGRLTRDPEQKMFENDSSVTNFTVAVDRAYKDKSGEKQTDFFDCKAWGKRGDVIAKFFSKGSEIVVSGEMQSRKYQDKDGNGRTAWQVQLNDFDFCGSKADKDRITTAPGSPLLVEADDLDDGDLPF